MSLADSAKEMAFGHQVEELAGRIAKAVEAGAQSTEVYVNICDYRKPWFKQPYLVGNAKRLQEWAESQGFETSVYYYSDIFDHGGPKLRLCWCQSPASSLRKPQTDGING